MKKIRYMLVMVVIVFVCGCGGSGRVVRSAGPVILEGTDTQTTMDCARGVLDDMQFTIEKYDMTTGIITTRPFRGRQWFELWRPGNSDPSWAAESNIQSIQKTARIEITDRPGRTEVICSVGNRRLSIPQNQPSSFSGIGSVFSDKGGQAQQLQIGAKSKETLWVDLGRDIALENRILKQIEQKANRMRNRI